MKKNLFWWLALLIAIIVVPPSPVLRAQAVSNSSGGETAYNFALLFCIIVSGVCLIGLCLSAFLKKD